MKSFLLALQNPAFPFLRNALFAGLLSAILFGVLGSVLTVRRMTSLAGAISHAVLGGIGLSLFLSYHFAISWFPPIIGALVFALLSALLVGLVSLKARQREDTVINAIWAIGMSLGVLFLAKTPGYTDPMTYLFGNILLVSTRDLYLLLILDMIIMVLLWRYYREIEASSFDSEFARARGVRVNLIFMLILVFTAVAVVLLQGFVGIVMVIAMLSLPAGTASWMARSLFTMMLYACILAAFYSFFGLMFAWAFDLPAGAVTVVLAGLVFVTGAAVKAKGV